MFECLFGGALDRIYVHSTYIRGPTTHLHFSSDEQSTCECDRCFAADQQGEEAITIPSTRYGELESCCAATAGNKMAVSSTLAFGNSWAEALRQSERLR